VVVVVWEEYERAKEPVETEANELAGDYFLADRFSDEADRQRVQELARSYARTVVEEEWPLMDSGETSERADEVLRDLRLSLQGVDASTSAGQVLYDQGSRGYTRCLTPGGCGCWRSTKACPGNFG
jgi:Protein of unknown function (DUF4239)